MDLFSGLHLAEPVTVEIHGANGSLMTFEICGLPLDGLNYPNSYGTIFGRRGKETSRRGILNVEDGISVARVSNEKFQTMILESRDEAATCLMWGWKLNPVTPPFNPRN
ncbi:POC1 [Lepeophtheirus salmonis]|uniref:POC1 n=1 Tax=Lepeophtheirus salmonis TaxID=72036 RepID=A0A7R8CQY2_LEPSM|nr:POC1 [Lepeophtheirus salmonis]CAF2899740.1 POC1 [Lepeophtheirus salmonis]